MRIASKALPDMVLNQLNKLAHKQSKLQNQISSGQHISKASDSPNAFVKLLNFQSEDRSIEQFQKNIDFYKEVSSNTYSIVDSMKSVINRAQEIATRSDSLKSKDELAIFAVEVNELLNQAVNLANSESRDKFLFAGTAVGEKPFEATKDADNKITAVNYQGNENAVELVISDNLRTSPYLVGENDSGSGAFGLFKDSRTGTNVFQSLINLRDRLESGDSGAVINDSIAELEKEEDNIIFHIGSIGASQSSMEEMSAVLAEKSNSLNKLSSREADVDITETVMLLNQTQLSYQAALQSAGKVLNTSLLDYIR